MSRLLQYDPGKRARQIQGTQFNGASVVMIKRDGYQFLAKHRTVEVRSEVTANLLEVRQFETDQQALDYAHWGAF